MAYENIEFKNIEFAYKIYEEKTVTNAAKALYTSQSSVTKRLIKLEDALGFKIFKRNYKKMTITKKGKVFINDCKEIIDLYNETLNNYYNINSYILASNNFEEIIKVINNISKKEEFENINIDNIILSNNKILVELQCRKINFSLFSFINSDYNTIKLFADKNNIKYKIIKKSKIYVSVSKSSPLYNKNKICALDLTNHRFIEIENNNINNIKAIEILNLKNQIKTIKVNDIYEASIALKNSDTYLLGGDIDYNFNSNIRTFILEDCLFEVWYLYAYNINSNQNINLLNKIFICEIEKHFNIKG